MQTTIESCQDLIGYHFRDPSLLTLALTHSSSAPVRHESNERLEFLGDAVLALVVCQDLYERNEGLLEGEMTKIKSTVVSRQSCAAVADEIGLSELLILGKGMSTPASLPMSVSAAVLESLIGAIYLDGGMEPARRFILEHLRPQMDRALASEHQRDYKSQLQQHAQHRWGTTPEYHLLDEKGPDHSKCFEIAVSINGRHFPSAWGSSKKEAEQKAALRACEELGLGG